MRKPTKMYLLVVYGDLEQKSIIYFGKFGRIKDIFSFCNDKLFYVDVNFKKERCYKTFKSLFRIIKLTQYEKMKYFYLN